MKIIKKLSVIILSISFGLSSIFSLLPLGKAATIEATVTANTVNFRSGPGTGFARIETLNSGYIVSLLNTKVTNGDGCPTGWYNVYYNGHNGYVCASYLNVPGIGVLDELGRPWTSPKKSIIGGAKFISSGYISKGQNTSYLKKFNVNPNSYYSTYKHQYMANLAAPYSEANTSFRSYRNNNLLSLPLHFTIPIYDNMPDYTTHPISGKEEGGTSIISDKNFEKKLDDQKFPETYKKWLRELHNQYSNWTFSTLFTNLDFNIAVENEKWSSSINKGNCPTCIDASNTNTEGNWYIANTETTGYFLDPRNFLMADSILMFEDLSYNENYTESVVKSVLSGTFMSGTDTVDNISYSSMFVQAGKENNVSPVYLASLSRQEVGASLGLVTSGNKFEYKGLNYIGFYNFYNIGAYSSEENPAKAGLVYAAKGASKNDDGIFVGNIGSSGNEDEEDKPGDNITPVATHLARMELNKKGSYLTNVSINSTVGALKSKTTANEIIFKNASGGVVGDSEKIGTGTSISFQTGENYVIVLYGDLTGDGNINSADLLRMRQHLLGQISLSDAYLEAARLVNQTGNVNSADLLRMRQYLLGQKGINQA